MNNKKTNHFQNCLGVFQGGGVKAVAFAGAYQEAVKRGVYFSELAGASAGSIAAVLIAAGATPKQLFTIMMELDFKQFLKKAKRNKVVKWRVLLSMATITPKKWAPYKVSAYFSRLGFYHADFINEWVNTELQKLLKKDGIICFKDLYLPVSVVVTDLNTKKLKVWSTDTTPDAPVGTAIQMSCSIPFFFQPFENRYVDGGLLSNLPAFLLKPESLFDRILAFGFVDEKEYPSVKSGMGLFKRLIDTTIDGATDIQLKIQRFIPIIQISTEGVEATDFDKLNKEKKKFLVNSGRLAADNFFNDEANQVKYEKLNNEVATDVFGQFNLILKGTLYQPKDVTIIDDIGIWIYSLFPVLISWNANQAFVRIILKKNTEDEPVREYKIRLLQSMGFSVEEIDQIPFRAFIFDGSTRSGTAVVFPKENGSGVKAKIYNTEEDEILILRLLNEFDTLYKGKKIAATVANLIPVAEQLVVKKLKTVKQYRAPGIKIKTQEVMIRDLVFLTKYLKGYKYRMMESFLSLYQSANMPLFAPAVLEFANFKQSVVTPPILELHDGKLIVIEGNARLIYASRNAIEKVQAIVITGVSDGLPSDGRFDYRQIVVSDKKKSGQNRYPNFNKNNFRHIEESIREPKESLI